jgi:hypothetical protein
VIIEHAICHSVSGVSQFADRFRDASSDKIFSGGIWSIDGTGSQCPVFDKWGISEHSMTHEGDFGSSVNRNLAH